MCHPPNFCFLIALAVPVRPLIDHLEDEKIDEVKLLKVDTEGAEEMVLRGARSALSEGRIKYLLVEISPRAEEVSGRERGSTVRYLESLGYRGHLLENGKLSPLPGHHDYWVADTFWRFRPAVSV